MQKYNEKENIMKDTAEVCHSAGGAKPTKSIGGRLKQYKKEKGESPSP